MINEEKIKEITEKIINPLQQEHIKFLETIIKQVEIAFLEGIEIGKKQTLEEAIESVPEEEDKSMFFTDDTPQTPASGFNHYRQQTLSNLQALKDK